MNGSVISYVPSSDEAGDGLLEALGWWIWEQGSSILKYDDDLVDEAGRRYYCVPVELLDVAPPIPWRSVPVVVDGTCRVEEKHVIAMSPDDWDLVGQMINDAINHRWVDRSKRNGIPFHADSAKASMKGAAAEWHRLGGMEGASVWVEEYVSRQWVWEVAEQVTDLVGSGSDVRVHRCDKSTYPYQVWEVWMSRSEVDLLEKIVRQVGANFSVADAAR